VIREAGHELYFHDVMFDKNTLSVASMIQQVNPSVFILYDDGFNYLTKMCLTNMREAALSMIRYAKAQGCTVIISSSDSTDRYEEYLQQGADYVLLGEGEKTLEALINALDNAEPTQHLTGIAFRLGDQAIKNPRTPLIGNLDDLPFPAWDLLENEPYREMWMRSAGYFSINMATTRGCPFKCNWCAKPIYGNRYHSRSPQHVWKEIHLLQQLFGIDHIWFTDDIFGLKPGWIAEFATFINEDNLPVRFKIQSRADLITMPGVAASLARAGCENVWMGAESGSQEILDAMDKGITIAQIHAATSLLRQHHIQPCFFIQFGYPGEKMDDISKTIRLILELLPEELGISVSYPLPGTKFYEKVKHELAVKSNWTDSDELALMFSNTYPPGFYKRLHRYVHRLYRAKKAWRAGNLFSVPYYSTLAGIDKLILNRIAYASG
jgi:radical SAM superfamily enzyme YgiQ (UPF0313 family)